MIRDYNHLIKPYPHGTNVFKVCESEMLIVMK